MLHALLERERATLILRCKSKVALRLAHTGADMELERRVPVLLDQLIATLRPGQVGNTVSSRRVPFSMVAPDPEIAIDRPERASGGAPQDFTVHQVLHAYGDLFETITELASQRRVTIGAEEFRAVDHWLDDAIRDAVAEFSRALNVSVESRQRKIFDEELGVLAHELRNHLQIAGFAVAALKSIIAGFAGANAAALERSLAGMRKLIDQSLAQVRVGMDTPSGRHPVAVAELISEIAVGARLLAHARGCPFAVSAIDPGLAIDVDRDLLSSAVSNLLQNAIKFTKPGTLVRLNAYGAGNRVRIDIEDNCGGIPGGGGEHLFLPFTQGSSDTSGVGLGLSICRRNVELHGGTLSVSDHPGQGCEFTIDLPRQAVAQLPLDLGEAPESCFRALTH